MPIRQTTHVLKKSIIPSQTLPASGILEGEPLVNIGDGILYFTGGTSGLPTWVQSDNPTPGYFEVGSNIYQLKIRDKIFSYSGVTNLSGLFLSGTSTGFVLANISDIYNPSVDVYVTGSTYSGSTDLTNQTTHTLLYHSTPLGGPYTLIGEDTYTTGGTYDNNTRLITFLRNDGLTGYTVDLSTIDVNDTYVTGGTNNSATTNSPNATIDLLYNQDVAPGTYFLPYSDVFLTGFTYSNNLFTLYDNSGNTYSQIVNEFTGLTINGDLTVTGNTNLQSLTATTTNINGDLIVTGNTIIQSLTATTTNINGDLTVTGNTVIQSLTATTTNINGDLTVTGNTVIQALTAATTNINGNLTVTGDTSLQALTATTIFVSGFVPTQVVYVGPNGELTGENTFTYDQTGNTLNVDNVIVSNDVIIQGDLQVFGAAISAFTSNLYVEDPNIYLNYNPTGSTTVTSVNAGFTVQDGNGVATGDVNFDIVKMWDLTGLTPTQIPDVSEYTGPTGYVNRGWITQLNDIIIRSTDVTDSQSAGQSPGDINGVRVLGEFDVLDGGSY
jgi:hypothetical protein